MKRLKPIVLCTEDGDEITINVNLDLKQVHAFIAKQLDQVLNYNIYTELEIAIPLNKFHRSAADVASPEYTNDRMHIMCKFSTLNLANFKDKALYIRWMYQHHNQSRYESKRWQNIKSVIDTEKLLSAN